MKITKELLIEKKACREGVELFEATFGADGVEFYGDSRDIATLNKTPAMKQYLDWFLTIFCSDRLFNYSPDLRGEISPDLMGWISPDLRGEISPDLMGWISPDLRGDVSGIRGWISLNLRGDVSGLHGEISPNLRGDVSNLWGEVPPDLRGDVSNLRGDVSKLKKLNHNNRAKNKRG